MHGRWLNKGGENEMKSPRDGVAENLFFFSPFFSPDQHNNSMFILWLTHTHTKHTSNIRKKKKKRTKGVPHPPALDGEWYHLASSVCLPNPASNDFFPSSVSPLSLLLRSPCVLLSLYAHSHFVCLLVDTHTPTFVLLLIMYLALTSRYSSHWHPVPCSSHGSTPPPSSSSSPSWASHGSRSTCKPP